MNIMIYKWLCLVTVLLIIMLLHLTKQHFMPPPDFCAFAKTCNHTGASICGIEMKNLITRLFLDDCDLFEYNCDHHKDYIKTDTEKCPPNETVPKSTIASTLSTTILFNTSSIETPTENNSEIVYTTVMESSTKPTIETVITTSLQTNPSSNTTTPKMTCVCPTVTCPAVNITTTMVSPMDNSTIFSSNTISSSSITVSSTETTIVSTIAEATDNSMGSKSTMNSIHTEAPINLTSPDATNNSISTEAKINSSSTEANTNSTITEATINLTSTAATNSTITEATRNLSRTEETNNLTITTVSINSTSAETTINPISIEASPNLTSTEVPTSPLMTVSIITNSINLTKSVSTFTTCTISKATSLDTEVISNTVVTTPKDEKNVLPQFKEDDKGTVGTGKGTKTSQNKCAYPKHCNRPSTWETTAKGETRDFYQILRDQFGDRVKLLRDTTHFPRRFAKDFSDNDEGFHFGYHNERTNEV